MIRWRRRKHADVLANIRRLELELGLRERDMWDYPSALHYYADSTTQHLETYHSLRKEV